MKDNLHSGSEISIKHCCASLRYVCTKGFHIWPMSCFMTLATFDMHPIFHWSIYPPCEPCFLEHVSHTRPPLKLGAAHAQCYCICASFLLNIHFIFTAYALHHCWINAACLCICIPHASMFFLISPLQSQGHISQQSQTLKYFKHISAA